MSQANLAFGGVMLLLGIVIGMYFHAQPVSAQRPGVPAVYNDLSSGFAIPKDGSAVIFSRNDEIFLVNNDGNAIVVKELRKPKFGGPIRTALRNQRSTDV